MGASQRLRNKGVSHVNPFCAIVPTFPYINIAEIYICRIIYLESKSNRQYQAGVRLNGVEKSGRVDGPPQSFVRDASTAMSREQSMTV